MLASRLCPVCQKVPIRASQGVCSGKCRAKKSRQSKAERLRRDLLELRSRIDSMLEDV